MILIMQQWFQRTTIIISEKMNKILKFELEENEADLLNDRYSLIVERKASFKSYFVYTKMVPNRFLRTVKLSIINLEIELMLM